MSSAPGLIARGAARSRLPLLGAVLLSAIAFAACGESSQDKAKAEVCAARSEISKQVTKLQGLTISSTALDEARSGLEAISKELKKIKDAQPKLSPARKEQVEAATKSFSEQLKTITAGVVAQVPSGSLSSALSSAEPKIKAALEKLGNAYKQALQPISC